MLTNVSVDPKVLANELNLGVRVFNQGGKALLNALHLLRDGRQDALFKTIKLVEAAPSTNLAETNEDATHGLEIECLVATEHQNETTELHPKGFDRLGFACETR